MADATTRANVSGTSTVLLTIRRQSGINTVAMVDAVNERLADIKAIMPPGYKVWVVRDLSEFIRASIDTVEEHLILGSILAALVVLIFLWNWRSTVIAAIAIPTSIIATFGLIWYEDFTLNSMTMLALTLAVGIVIDDAIVVLENIYRFVEEHGMNPYQAAVVATKEIGLAVMATTLSLIAIFVPVGFMGGIVGRFMKSFGLTMSFAILVSLLVSFTLTPMLSARWIKAKDKNAKASKDNRFFKPIDDGYKRLLAWSLAHRSVVAVGAVLILLSSVPLFMVANKNFLPNDDQSEFEVGVRAPGRHEHRRHRADREPHRGRRPASAGSRLHAGHDCRRPVADAEFRNDLRPPEAAGSAEAGSVRRHERRARERHAAVRGGQPAHRRAAGRHHRGRRPPERGDPVHRQRPGPREAGAVRQRDRRRGPQGARRRRRGHVVERRQARAVGEAGPPEGGGSRRPGRRRGRGAAAPGRRRSGHHIQ
jgi:hypothetical protein